MRWPVCLSIFLVLACAEPLTPEPTATPEYTLAKADPALVECSNASPDGEYRCVFMDGTNPEGEIDCAVVPAAGREAHEQYGGNRSRTIRAIVVARAWPDELAAALHDACLAE